VADEPEFDWDVFLAGDEVDCGDDGLPHVVEYTMVTSEHDPEPQQQQGCSLAASLNAYLSPGPEEAAAAERKKKAAAEEKSEKTAATAAARENENVRASQYLRRQPATTQHRCCAEVVRGKRVALPSLSARSGAVSKLLRRAGGLPRAAPRTPVPARPNEKGGGRPAALEGAFGGEYEALVKSRLQRNAYWDNQRGVSMLRASTVRRVSAVGSAYEEHMRQKITRTEPVVRPSRGKVRSPSRFCHICTASRVHGALAVCAGVTFGVCRKVVCSRCFSSANLGGPAGFAVACADPTWTCPHCNDACPSSATCKAYALTNAARVKVAKRHAGLEPAADSAKRRPPTRERHGPTPQNPFIRPAADMALHGSSSMRQPLSAPGGRQTVLAPYTSGDMRAHPTVSTGSPKPQQPVQLLAGRKGQSRYCHVCTSAVSAQEFLACSGRPQSLCSNIICALCFERHGSRDWADAAAIAKATGNWPCWHCAGACPREAACRARSTANSARFGTLVHHGDDDVASV
jgi:hypothetical protein